MQTYFKERLERVENDICYTMSLLAETTNSDDIAYLKNLLIDLWILRKETMFDV